MMYYAIENLINSNTLDSVSTEDPIYVKEWLYDRRPSRPFRFTAKVAQWVKVNLGAATRVTLAALFNHNLQNVATVQLEADILDFWAPPAYQQSVAWRSEDEHLLLDQTYQWWRLAVADATNPACPQLGDFFLGNWCQFTYAKVQPGRADGPAVHRATHLTPYGQIWSAYFGRTERFSIRLRNLNTASQVDELQTFVQAVAAAGGAFVFIPEHTLPHVFYVFLENESDFAQQITRGQTNELRDWNLQLRVLTKGITLL